MACRSCEVIYDNIPDTDPCLQEYNSLIIYLHYYFSMINNCIINPQNK